MIAMKINADPRGENADTLPFLHLHVCSLNQGVQQALWGRRDDSQAFRKENCPLLHPVDTDQLPVPHGLEKTHRHRCLRPVLLPQGFCLSPVLDRSEGPFHGCSGPYEKDPTRIDVM